ncbi:hypothetical protein Micbo1qcDRAFT_162314 [Microdochium bolleyi]|uniref:Uncharacterized protein n=1 Tax=Microdochium bolleyi TaxID=196109 RepID=A0A136J4T7_9PEZI|nr:hypothetical protein Micbo1qcDRAFT_162314 [Microdochium bolleyi]
MDMVCLLPLACVRPLANMCLAFGHFAEVGVDQPEDTDSRMLDAPERRRDAEARLRASQHLQRPFEQLQEVSVAT